MTAFSRDNNGDKPEIHRHIFVYSADLSQQRCQCGAIGVSYQEYLRRCGEYRQYLDDCRNTESFRDYLRMGQLVKAYKQYPSQDVLQEMRELRKKGEAKLKTVIKPTRVKSTVLYLESQELINKLPEPNYPDPFDPRHRYVDIQTGNSLTAPVAE